MKNLLKSLLIIVLVSFLGCNKTPSKKETIISSKKWQTLFNGKNLNDWIIKIKGHPVGHNFKNTFIVEDSVLKVNYKAYDSFNNSFGHIFHKNSFSNYKLRMDYRFTGHQIKGGASWANRNSGIMIHCENPKNIGLNQDFPVSIEVQLLGGDSVSKRSTGNLCTPGTHVEIDGQLITEHCINSSSETFPDNQWVHIEIEVRNDSIIKHFINDKEVLRYSKPQYGGDVDYNNDYWKSKENLPLKSGFISLQSESHPVEFKNIEILAL